MSWFGLVLLALIIILWFVAGAFAQHFYNFEDTTAAYAYIGLTKAKIQKSPMDYYRLGALYDFVLRDAAAAHQHYVQALTTAPADAFITTRIRDRIKLEPEADDPQLEIFMIRELEQFLDKTEEKIKTDTEPKNLEDRVVWHSDSQNVHDHNINNELKISYDQIVCDNRGKYLWDIPDILNYISHIYQPSANEAHNVQPAIKMLEYIQRHSAHIMKLQITERTFISHIFTKIYNTPIHRQKIMLENFLLCLAESYNKGNPVCITGRATRLISCFTNLDEKNPDLGIFRSKPIIRNEIMLKAANIRNSIYNAADSEIQKKYDLSILDEDTRQLENEICLRIQHMIDEDYADMQARESKFIKDLFEEIKQSI